MGREERGRGGGGVMFVGKRRGVWGGVGWSFFSIGGGEGGDGVARVGVFSTNRQPRERGKKRKRRVAGLRGEQFSLL